MEVSKVSLNREDARAFLILLLTLAVGMQSVLIVALRMLPSNDMLMLASRHQFTNLLGAAVIALLIGTMVLSLLSGDKEAFVATFFGWVLMGILRFYDGISANEQNAWRYAMGVYALLLVTSLVILEVNKRRPNHGRDGGQLVLERSRARH